MGWVRIAPNRLKWFDDNATTKKKSPSHYVIPDIEPYKAVAGDMAGKWIKSRKEHRQFLQRNGFVEVGNEHRQFFEYGGKSRDNLWAERNPNYSRAEFEGRAGRRTKRT
jgi:hypothetical protein